MDLSQHALRSVSPVHLEYLRNMGVAASMSISIVSGGRLWGLIACHHRAPRLVPPGIRDAADLFGLFVSMRVAAREQEQVAAAEEAARGAREALSLRLSSATDVDAALPAQLGQVQQAVPCAGVAMRLGGTWSNSGRVPARLEALAGWLAGLDRSRVASSDLAREWLPEGSVDGDGDGDGIAGVLAIPLGEDDWLLHFRPEQVEDVRWAGDPDKPALPGDDGRRIAPRKSFATWRETVHGRSPPWSDGDRRAAERLRLVLWEHRNRGRGGDSTIVDPGALRRRDLVRDQKSRLEQLSALLDGLVHLDDADASRLASRINALEEELNVLMQGDAAPATR